MITRAGHEPVVMVALDEYESLKESAYQLPQPRGRSAPPRRLPGAIERLEHGGGTAHELRLVYKIVADEVRVAACRYHDERWPPRSRPGHTATAVRSSSKLRRAKST